MRRFPQGNARLLLVRKVPHCIDAAHLARVRLRSGPRMKKQFLVASFLSLLVGCSPNGMNPLPETHVSTRVMNAVDRGPVPADMMFDLVVGVRMRNAERLPIV